MFLIIGLFALVIAGWLLTRSWLWYLVGGIILLVFIDHHTTQINTVLGWIATALSVIVPAVALLLLVGAVTKIRDWHRDRKNVLDELPAPTTEYPTSPAYVPSKYKVRS